MIHEGNHNASNYTDAEIMDMIKKAEGAASAEVTDGKTVNRRNLLVVGCGDGGAMIASQVKKNIPETYCICYNTSSTAMTKWHSDVNVITEGKDGSGKARSFSKDVFKENAYKVLLGKIQTALNVRTDISYVVVIATTDGGTGSGMSPMIAKLIAANTSIPVVIIGVYPSLKEDAIAQFNAMEWQKEVAKTGIPYMIFDNNVDGNKIYTHSVVNDSIVNSLKVITGDFYDQSTASMIDSRDLYMLLAHMGKRIMVFHSTKRPATNQTLDDYILSLIDTMHQPLPRNVRGIGLFVKASSELLNRLDTNLEKVCKKYGDPTVQYLHIQESDVQTMVSVIFSGCSEPADRLMMLRSRYDDIMSSQEDEVSILDNVSDVKNPFGSIKNITHDPEELDLSALDL